MHLGDVITAASVIPGALDVIRMGKKLSQERAMIWGFPSILGSGLPS